MNCVTEESNNILGCSLTRNTPMQKVLYSACEMLPEKEKNLYMNYNILNSYILYKSFNKMCNTHTRIMFRKK